MFKEWFKRYWPVEVVGISSNLLATFIMVKVLDFELLYSAIFVSTFEVATFYVFVVFREIYSTYKRNGKYKANNLVIDLRNLVIEFGPGELIDPVFTRPFFIYLGISYFENDFIGGLIGKFSADIIFYSISGVFYEVRKKLFKS
jgi:hypothetical protein